jgi:hypothetical protein
MFSKHLITLGFASVAVNAYSACWWGYESDFDWEEDYSNGSITAFNETRWKLNDLGYAWGGGGAFYSYDGYREFDQPMPDGVGTGLKFSVKQDYCNDNPGKCVKDEYTATYAGS